MKMKFLIPVLLLFCACAGTGKTGQSATNPSKEQPASETKPESPVSTEPGTDKDSNEKSSQKAENELYRVVVSFYSKGEGIDEKALINFSNFLQYFQEQYKITIPFQKTPWGREGEVDYCVDLKNLDFEKQNLFLLQTREILIQSQLVHIVENAPCKHKQ